VEVSDLVTSLKQNNTVKYNRVNMRKSRTLCVWGFPELLCLFILLNKRELKCSKFLLHNDNSIQEHLHICVA